MSVTIKATTRPEIGFKKKKSQLTGCGQRHNVAEVVFVVFLLLVLVGWRLHYFSVLKRNV